MSLSPRTKAILICGAIVLSISLGIRHAFGLYLQPISIEHGWGRETFALAIALQNLVWGISQPFAGMIADRRGAGVVVLGGGILFAMGVALMSVVTSVTMFLLVAGVVVGLGLSGTTMPVVFGVISRAMPAEKRSLAFGIAMSVGSLGQFVLLPGSRALIDSIGWANALMILAALAVLIIPLAFSLKEEPTANKGVQGLATRDVLKLALHDRGFQLLSLGFFVCGFQVVFIATHMPVFLLDQGLEPTTGATVLALIGLFNIFGTLSAGWLGGKFKKPMLLSFIYFARAVAIIAFLVFPITAFTAYAFAIAMGLLWLSTVPLTNGAVATMFGVKHMSLLGGIVFLSHQIGSFLGVWLGGYVFDKLGSYDVAWTFAVGLSLVAGLVNLPIKEAPVESKATA